MKKIFLFILFCSIILIHTTGCAIDMKPPDVSSRYNLGPNEVLVGHNGIIMPLGRILLIRRDSKYCAIKFTKAWTEKDGKENFALYQVHYQGDGTGDFSKQNVEVSEKEASFLIPRGIGRIWFQFGNPEVRCGSLKLLWTYKGGVCFFEKHQEAGDYGIHLAPTPWTNIKEVNVFDPRVRWYRYGEEKKYINIPIDKLWEDKK